MDNNFEKEYTPEQVPEQPEQVPQQPEQVPQQADVWANYQNPVNNAVENNGPNNVYYQQNNGYYYQQEAAYVPPQPPKKKKGKKFLLWGGIAAAVIAVAVAVFLILSNTYKTPINIMEKQANAKKAGNPYDQRIEMLNGFCAKEQKAIYKIMKKADNYEDRLEDYKDSFEERIEDREDEYGDNYKITYKIIDKEKIEKDELKEVRDEIRERGESMLDQYEDMDSDDYEEGADALGITKSQAKDIVKNLKAIGKKMKSVKVTDGYTLTVAITITGSELDEPEEQEQEINVYKVDGRWISASGLYMAGSLY